MSEMEEDLKEAMVVLRQCHGAKIASAVGQILAARGCLLQHRSGQLDYRTLEVTMNDLIATALLHYIPDADRTKLSAILKEVQAVEKRFYSGILNDPT